MRNFPASADTGEMGFDTFREQQASQSEQSRGSAEVREVDGRGRWWAELWVVLRWDTLVGF